MSKLSNPVSILCIILPPLTAPEADSSPCNKQTNSACDILKDLLQARRWTTVGSRVCIEVLLLLWAIWSPPSAMIPPHHGRVELVIVELTLMCLRLVSTISKSINILIMCKLRWKTGQLSKRRECRQEVMMRLWKIACVMTGHGVPVAKLYKICHSAKTLL